MFVTRPVVVYLCTPVMVFVCINVVGTLVLHVSVWCGRYKLLFFYTFLQIHLEHMQIVCERCLQNQSKSELELIFKINLLSSNFITLSCVYTDVSNMLSTCFTKIITVFLFLICWKQKISYPSVVSKIKECFLKNFINMLPSGLAYAFGLPYFHFNFLFAF